MQVTTKAVILTSLKYGDTSLIVKAFTISDGLKSYLLRGVLSSKKAKIKAAYFQPLMQLELVASHRNKGTLESIKEVKVSYHYKALHTDITKNALALFLAEMLSNSIHEEEKNEQLFAFVEAALQWLDMHENVANFHLYFLLVLTKYLGFYPDTKFKDALYFDLLEGEFVLRETLNPILKGEPLYYFKEFLDASFDSMVSIKMAKEQRNKLLQFIVLYYELHLQGFRKPKSLAVLNEVFN